MADSIRAFAAVGATDDFCTAWAYEPRALQPEDVDIRVVACGVCHSDVHQCKREWKGAKQQRPLVPGHEIVGVVVRAGAKARHSVGDRVAVGTCVGSCGACEQCLSGEENYCRDAVDTYTGTHVATKSRTHGGFAERVVVDSRFAFAVPPQIPSTTAAPLMCAGVTVFAPLHRLITPGLTTVGIVGIGGLGHLGLQFARALGAKRVTAITSTANKNDAAKAFGAHDVLVSSDRDAMGKAGNSFDVLLVTVSGDLSWGSYLRLLRVGGTLCLVGLSPSGEMKINPFAITGKRLRVEGSNTGGSKDVHAMFAVAAQHNVRVAVELLPLSVDGANEALARVAKSTPRFRCVMVPGGKEENAM